MYKCQLMVFKVIKRQNDVYYLYYFTIFLFFLDFVQRKKKFIPKLVIEEQPVCLQAKEDQNLT